MGLRSKGSTPLDQAMNSAHIFRDGLASLIAELKRDGRAERRIPLRNGKRREKVSALILYAFAWSDPADLLFEGARVSFQSGRDTQEATVVLLSAEQIVLQLTRDLGDAIDTATIVVDQTTFLEALRRRMDDIAIGKAVAFNSAQVKACWSMRGRELRLHTLSSRKN